MQVLFEYWEHSPPAFESLAGIERMMASYFGVKQRPSAPAASRPATVVDLQDIPGMAQGAPIPWMSADEYLRRRAQNRESNGNE